MHRVKKQWRKIQKYFYKTTSYEISPANDKFNECTTFSVEENLPSKCISFVTEASDVKSLPLTIPAESN
jgi:hypothetical protein